jgi:hypothetical protein
MAYLIWLVIFGLIIFAYLNPIVPWWIPLIVYTLAVFVRTKEKIGNYNDWIRKKKRDEQSKLKAVADEMANRGLAFSGIRQNAEKKVKEDFEFERREKNRKFWVELVDSLFLR